LFPSAWKEDAKMTFAPEILQNEAVPYVCIPIRASLQQWDAVNQQLANVYAWLDERDIAPAGAPFYRYRVIGGDAQPWELDVAVPVATAVSGDERVASDELPSGTYAVHTHHGHPDGLFEAGRLMLEWAERTGHQWDVRDESGEQIWGGRCEIFMTDPETEPDLNKWETRMVWRLRDSDPEVSD
jgi:effector-binding domain-containing protein